MLRPRLCFGVVERVPGFYFTCSKRSKGQGEEKEIAKATETITLDDARRVISVAEEKA